MRRALLLALTLASCGGDDGNVETGCGVPRSPGVQNLTITVAGVERSYLLSVPTGYDPAEQTPLVFAWHDLLGGTAEGARSLFRIEMTAPVPAIFVYPQALAGMPRAWDLEPDGIDVAFTMRCRNACARTSVSAPRSSPATSSVPT